MTTAMILWVPYEAELFEEGLFSTELVTDDPVFQ